MLIRITIAREIKQIKPERRDIAEPRRVKSVYLSLVSDALIVCCQILMWEKESGVKDLGDLYF